MHNLIKTARSEMRFLLHTPPVLLVLLVAPLVYPFMYNYLYVNKFETKIPVSVADLDRSANSRELTRLLGATEQLRITPAGEDLSRARTAIENGTAQGYIIIPENYERDIIRGRRPVLRAYINATRVMVAVDIGKGIAEAIAGLGKGLQVQAFTAAGISLPIADRWSQPVVLRSEGVANTIESYGDFIIPALLLLILQQSLLAGTATASAGRKRKPQTGAVSWLAGRAIPYLVLYSIYALLFFAVQYRIWNIPFSGSSVALAILTGVEFVAVIAGGFLLGDCCRSRLSALLLAMFSSYPFFLLSGLAWPRQSLPPVLQMVSSALPSTWYFPAALSLSRLDADWADVLPHLCALAAIFAALGAILYFRTRNRIDRSALPQRTL